ncbi:hypothetical protein D3C73_1488200 [compost metagenome]
MDLLQEAKEPVKEAGTAQEAAVRVRYVFIDLLIVSGKPIERRSRRKEVPIKAAESHRVHQQAGMAVALQQGLDSGQGTADAK